MYQPKPGTPAARMIEFLSLRGGPVSAADLGSAGGIKPSSVAAVLTVPIKHGLAHRVSVGSYAAGPGAGKPATSAAGARKTPRSTPAPVVAPEADDASAFSVDLYSDGEVVILNPATANDGVCRLDSDQVTVLFNFLSRFASPKGQQL